MNSTLAFGGFSFFTFLNFLHSFLLASSFCVRSFIISASLLLVQPPAIDKERKNAALIIIRYIDLCVMFTSVFQKIFANLCIFFNKTNFYAYYCKCFC